MRFIIWQAGATRASYIEADDAQSAIDLFAQLEGAKDFADLATARNWPHPFLDLVETIPDGQPAPDLPELAAKVLPSWATKLRIRAR